AALAARDGDAACAALGAYLTALRGQYAAAHGARSPRDARAPRGGRGGRAAPAAQKTPRA
ncbi:MAG: hypothetical protein KGJ52_10620, partial [Gammaproteobacteria bacterium]|nr:hypothetical protein [Gammaproteobacteria bacterium]